MYLEHVKAKKCVYSVTH